MYRSLSLSILFHTGIFAITFFTLPFIVKKPIDVPPIISIDLIQISDKTALPFAPKAREIIEKIKEEKERVVTKQAPPKIVKKEKQDAVPMPDQIKKKKPKETDKQNPEEVKDEIRQSSEFEKKELFDPNKIAALIDKSKEETADIQQKQSLEITQDQDSTVSLDKGLTITQEDAIKAQIFKCWRRYQSGNPGRPAFVLAWGSMSSRLPEFSPHLPLARQKWPRPDFRALHNGLRT